MDWAQCKHEFREHDGLRDIYVLTPYPPKAGRNMKIAICPLGSHHLRPADTENNGGRAMKKTAELVVITK